MQSFQEPIALFILTLWLGIWLIFFFGGTRKNTLEAHPALLRYSSLTCLLIFVFYSVLFTPALSIGVTNTSMQLWASGLFMLMGAYLMISARLAMKNMTAKEVLFSINPTYATGGIYKHATHPMYLGILMILVGSLSAYPSLPAFIILLGVCYCLYEKANLE